MSTQASSVTTTPTSFVLAPNLEQHKALVALLALEVQRCAGDLLVHHAASRPTNVAEEQYRIFVRALYAAGFACCNHALRQFFSTASRNAGQLSRFTSPELFAACATNAGQIVARLEADGALRRAAEHSEQLTLGGVL